MIEKNKTNLSKLKTITSSTVQTENEGFAALNNTQSLFWTQYRIYFIWQIQFFGTIMKVYEKIQKVFLRNKAITKIAEMFLVFNFFLIFPRQFERIRRERFKIAQKEHEEVIQRSLCWTLAKELVLGSKSVLIFF